MTRYDFIWARQVILSNAQTDFNVDLISLLVNILKQIMIRYDLILTRRVILSNVRTNSTLPNLDFGKLVM